MQKSKIVYMISSFLTIYEIIIIFYFLLIIYGDHENCWCLKVFAILSIRHQSVMCNYTQKRLCFEDFYSVYRFSGCIKMHPKCNNICQFFLYDHSKDRSICQCIVVVQAHIDPAALPHMKRKKNTNCKSDDLFEISSYSLLWQC